MKAMTVVITFKDDEIPEAVNFGSRVLGGEVTALAAYDMFHTMDIAEQALENSSEDDCIEAAEKIERYIVNGMG